MEMVEVINLRRKLERDIFELLRTFTSATSTTPTRIDLQTASVDAIGHFSTTGVVVTAVRVEVHL